MAVDKKALDGGLRLILMDAIGKAGLAMITIQHCCMPRSTAGFH